MHRRAVLSLGAAVGAAVARPGVGSATAGASTATPTSHAPYRPLDSRSIDGTTEAVVSEDGRTAYVATTDGFAVVDVSDPTDVALLAERRGLLADREAGPLRDVQDVAVDDDRLLVVGPAHGGPALQAALLYDVSDPANPRRVAVHETDYPIHNGALDGDYAYLTGNDGDRNPLVIVEMPAGGTPSPTGTDATGRATTGRVVAAWSILDRDATWRTVHPALRVLHDVWVDDGVAVLAYWDAGTVLLDVSDPSAPAFLARIGDRGPSDLDSVESLGREVRALPGNHHYAELDPAGDVLAIGREAWSENPARAPGGIDLWDVSTRASPAHLARIPPPPTPDPSFGGTWTTAHNFDLRAGRLYSSWYQGGVKIHDVSDPANPREIAWWRMPEETRFWTARHAGDFFVASSMAFRGTRPAVYTFPDRPGEQPDPPALAPATPTSTPASTTSGPTSTASEFHTATPTSTSIFSTPTSIVPTPSPSVGQSIASPTGASSPDPDKSPAAPEEGVATTSREGDATATDGQAGFGVPAALVAVALGAVRRWRREE